MGAYKVKSGGRAFGRTVELFRTEQQRAEMLEVMLFAFVHNRTTYPMGKALGKTEDEILLKTLETVNAGMKIVDFEKARERLMRARRLMKERSGAEMMETKTYDCGRCANKRTPMCNACTVVMATDGTESKPKYFVKLSDKEIHTIGSGDSDISEDLALYIVRSIELGVPIPVALIMLWNRKSEAEE